MTTQTEQAQLPPLTGCLPWCEGHADRHDRHEPEEGSSWWHHWSIAEGQDSPVYGPLYEVGLERQSSGLVRLWVNVETATLTADQAEVLGRALLAGAEALRSSGESQALDVICPSYPDPSKPGGYADVPNLVPTPTAAELELQRG